VQSAFRSFFVAAREGKFELRRSGDLWRLLAQITVNKLLKKAEYYAAGKRRLNAEESNVLESRAAAARFERLAQTPAAADVAALNEELELVMHSLSPTHREMLAQRLQGASIAEIAEQFQVTERQVRRVLQKVQQHFEARLAENSLA
jgi:DNA-directed RNA polymerase specialized sigma24 family protein